MLLSRFWYVFLALLLGAAMFVLYLATSMYNRASARMQGEGLSSDSQVVSWYLRDDARQRAAQLIPFALNQDIGKFLQESSDSEAKVPQKSRDKVRAALDAREQEGRARARVSTRFSRSTSTGASSRISATSRRAAWRTSSSAAIRSWPTRSTATFATTRWCWTASIAWWRARSSTTPVGAGRGDHRRPHHRRPFCARAVAAHRRRGRVLRERRARRRRGARRASTRASSTRSCAICRGLQSDPEYTEKGPQPDPHDRQVSHRAVRAASRRGLGARRRLRGGAAPASCRRTARIFQASRRQGQGRSQASRSRF